MITNYQSITYSFLYTEFTNKIQSIPKSFTKLLPLENASRTGDRYRFQGHYGRILLNV